MRTRTIMWQHLFLAVTLFFLGVPTQAKPPQKLRLTDVSVGPGRIAETIVGLDMPAGGNLPSHLRYSFDEDKLPETIRFRDRQLLIFPVAEYRTLFVGKERKEFDRRIQFLSRVINDHIGEAASEIPIFPPAKGAQLFRAKVNYLRFEKGSGVRFVTRYAVDKSPTTNENIFYTFQGLSKDGQSLIVFVHPIAAHNLPVSEDASMAALFMDQLSSENFSPNLDKLDDIVRGITIDRKPSPK